MNWKVTDKRADENAPSDGEIRDAENERQRKRMDVKLEIARLSLLKERAGHLQAEIQRIDNEAEQAADSHQAACTPLQIELSELEQLAISRIARREPSDAESDARRGEIVQEIQGHNEALELVVQRCKRLREPLENQQTKLLVEAASIVGLRAKLTRPPLVDPALAIRAHIAEQRKAGAGARLAWANRALKIISANITAIHNRQMSRADLPAQLSRQEKWQAELGAAGQEQADALTEAAELGHKMIDE